MRMAAKIMFVVGALALAVPNVMPKARAAAGVEDDHTVVVVLKDGHQQTFRFVDVARIEFGPRAVIVFNDGRQQTLRLAEIARIDFNSSSSAASSYGRARFLGVWKVGIGGDNSGTFLITLKPDGIAEKTIGSHGGTWAVINGEARCKWDDGWTDVIRKVEGRWEKAAYSPGSSLDDPPASVAEAVYTEAN